MILMKEANKEPIPEKKTGNSKIKRYRIVVLIDNRWEEVWAMGESKENALDNFMRIARGIESLRFNGKPIEVYI